MMAPLNKAKSHKRSLGSKDFQSKKSVAAQKTASDSLYNLPPEVQQSILNTFATAFPIVEDLNSLRQIIQEVKGHLFNRDFSAAFSQNSYLQAYAVRWSAARALGYSHILARITNEHVRKATAVAQPPKNSDSGIIPISASSNLISGTTAQDVSQRIVCIGGGAGAELVALAACHKYVIPDSVLEIITIDNADWDDPVTQLSAALSSPPRLPAHASEAAKARPENQALLGNSSTISVSFLHQDVLNWSHENMSATVSHNTILCTIMFTLNELFSASLPRTTSFLLTLTELLTTGSLLLVVDSPGSYSEIQMGRDKQQQQQQTNNAESVPDSNASTNTNITTKRYPMKWLLDHTLLDVAGKDEDAKWEKVESEDSLWFRIEQREKLRYPVELENMRYQLHLYRRK